MDARLASVPPHIDHVLDALRGLDLLGPGEIALVLPELARVQAKLWLSALAANQVPLKVAPGPAPQLVTVKEAATHLRYTPGHVYELVRSGRLRAIRDGRTLRIAREALAEWPAAHQTDRLDDSPRGSGELPLHDERRASRDDPHPRPERAPRRRNRPPMRGD